MSHNINKYSYAVQNGYVKGSFNIYQSRSGHIYLTMNDKYTKLLKNQIAELGIDIFSLQDFDYDDYLTAYKDAV